MMDLSYLSIADAGRLFRTKELSPSELAGHLLERINRINPQCHAFLQIDEDAVLAQAAIAEAEMSAGNWRGPLHGIPYALKDLIDVAGIPTTCHSKILSGNKADHDATVVSRLRDAGAILIGKTSLHEFAIGGPSRDLPWPPALNPWNLDLHPGGSSSGSGAALAAGLVPAALGTDTGGSIRNPATCCGVVGMKPTYGLVSRHGVFPLSFSLDHVGPMTRTVKDNALLLQVLAGFDSNDPTSMNRRVHDLSSQLGLGLKGLRIGVLEHFFTEDSVADSQLVGALQRATDVLAGLGANIAPARLAPLSTWVACGRVIQQAEQYVVHEKWLQLRPEDYCESSRSKLLAGAFISSRDYLKMSQIRRLLRNEFDVLMKQFDAVVTLSSFHLPCRIDRQDEIVRTYEQQARMPFNLTGTPVIAVPIGFSEDGLPLGMQIAAKAFDEAMLYRIADAYGRATEWTSRHPLESSLDLQCATNTMSTS